MSSRYFGLIPAAGSGERFGSSLPKQYSRILGQPTLHHAVAALLSAGEIETAFVVLAPGDEAFRRFDWSGFGDRVAPLYCGGASRRDSVLNGLIAAASEVEPDDWMLVHDAARPCLARADLRRLIDEAGSDDAGAILAVPVADTLKRADDERRILDTEPRDRLWQAQTPQMFRYGVLLRALQSALHATDEASAVEALGLHPKLVEGSTRNIKVTFGTDLELAALILQSARG